MSDVAIRIEGLSKRYYIGAREERYRTLRDELADAVTAPFRRAAKLLRGQATGAAELDEAFWALKDVSLQVQRGEVVGIIGRNGAGKTTLLKILSRITEPTEGFAEIHGRVGSLLEVGTGFHQELTGRENIFLNGAILGMKKAEIERKFDGIVAFAEIEKFIDTPVKHYSSGMYVRLAFAVAAHLEPEILVVDEVLSVGDASFQKKCLGKMGEVARSGRTVLFVSHNMGAITELCERAILLEEGRVKMDGEPGRVVGFYLSEDVEASGVWLRPQPDGVSKSPDITIRSVHILAGDGEPMPIVPFDEAFEVEIRYEVAQAIRDLVILCGVDNHRRLVWQSWDTDTTELRGRVREPGSYVSTCKVPARLLRPGRYELTVAAHIPQVRLIDDQQHILAFDVSQVGYQFASDRAGAITPLLEWGVVRKGRTPAELVPSGRIRGDRS